MTAATVQAEFLTQRANLKVLNYTYDFFNFWPYNQALRLQGLCTTV